MTALAELFVGLLSVAFADTLAVAVMVPDFEGVRTTMVSSVLAPEFNVRSTQLTPGVFPLIGVQVAPLVLTSRVPLGRLRITTPLAALGPLLVITRV